MKKALVILMALAMVFAAFADGPDVTPTVTSFTGSATFGYKIDLQNSKLGMTNDTSTELKIQWIGGAVTKSTEGSGIWGELTIKADGQIEVAGGNTAAIAVPTPSVETAKIHFNDMLTINILKPSLDIGSKDPALATGTTIAGVAAVNGGTLDNIAGFTAEISAGAVSANVKIADNGVVAAADKKFGFAADTTIKPIDGLEVYAGASYVDEFAAAANAQYALAVSDTMTLTPWAGMTFKGDVVYAAGALLGWGGADLEPGLKFVPNKTKDGFSVAINSAKDFVVGAYDSVFLAPFGLKAGFDYKATFDTIAKGTLNADVAGSWTVDIFSVGAYFGFQDALSTSTTDYKYGVSVSNTSLIANTTLSAAYDGGKGDKGAIVLTAKISL